MTLIKNSKKSDKEAPQGILDFIDDCLKNEDTVEWTGTLREYLPMVIEEPSLNDLAHARIWRMVSEKGIDFSEDDEKKKNPHFKFFEKDLFGVDHVISQVMEYFKAAAAGSEVSRRILLLWGPTSSGKSQFAILLKKGLEAFTRTKEGRMFAIDGCPMYENPLNAVPESARKMLKEKYGIIVEGELCPHCAYRLREEFKGDFWQFPVKRIFMSEMNRVGIGTFQPGDTKCVSGDSLVLTTDGLKRIDSLGTKNEEDIDITIINSDGELKKAVKFFKYDNKKVLNISTNFGKNIKVTPNHPLMTVNKDGEFVWKFANDFECGDVVVMSKNQGVDNFKFEELPENSLNIKWDGNTAMFFGLFVAEGSFLTNGHSVVISNKDPSIQEIVKIFANKINKKAPIYHDGKDVYINSFELVSFMKNIGFKTGAHNKNIPDVIWKSGFLKEFLIGMWLGDGNIGKHSTKNTNEASYCSVSYTLINQLHSALLLFGIPSVINCFPNSGTQGAYVLKISGERVLDFINVLNIPEYKYTRNFIDNVSHGNNIFLMPRTTNLIKKICYSIPGRSKWGRYWVEEEKTWKRRFSRQGMLNFAEEALEKNCNINDYNKLIKITDNKYEYAIVENISLIGKETVYDVEVPDGHEFIANGFISHNSQSQSELVGSVNFAKLEDYGVESHPLAYNFDGELNVANRGMMEFIEILKVDPRFRHILLTLAQEKRLKVERFPLIYADIATISHSNEVEYNRFLADKKEEALHDRIWVVKFPYNLRLDDEIKIYEKLICQTPGFKGIHIAPHTLKTAAMFAILSRLEEPKNKGISVLQKMHIYNGEDIDGFNNKNKKQTIKDLRQDVEREGLDGISPRYVVNRLAACFAKHDTKAVTPISALRSLEEGLTTNAKLNKDDISRLKNLIAVCVEEYSKIACNDVQKAFFVNFEHEISNLLSNYMDNVEAYLNNVRLENEWGDLVEADEALMRNIEEKIEITNTGKDSFREEVFRKIVKTKSEDGKYNYNTHPKLREALEKQLFEERKGVIRLTVSVRNPDPEALKRINEVVKVLCDQYDYNEESANELLRYVSNIMSKNK